MDTPPLEYMLPWLSEGFSIETELLLGSEKQEPSLKDMQNEEFLVWNGIVGILARDYLLAVVLPWQQDSTMKTTRFL
ncbi:hypothetical protein ES703_107919 [subsurface metagenome]